MTRRNAAETREEWHDTAPVTRTEGALRRRIAEYYDTTQVLYSNLWSSRGVHYGLWTEETRSLREAIRNHDQLVAGELGLPIASRILDAGCGVGGASCHLAEALRHEVVGVTLSRSQLWRARRRARGCRAPVPPKFLIGDYLATGFRDGSFDGVIAVESVCYAERKADFIGEARRLLRPGGRLVVADGFLARDPLGDERAAYVDLLDGLALPNLAMVEEFAAELQRAGFERIRCDDRRREILPSARRIARLSRIGVRVCALPCRWGLFPRTWLGHGLAGIAQRPLFESGAVTYCVFSATRA